MGSLLDKALKIKKELIDDSTPEEIIEKLETPVPLIVKKVEKTKKPTLKIGDKIKMNPEVVVIDVASEIVEEIVDNATDKIKGLTKDIEQIGRFGSFAESTKKTTPAKKLKKGRVFAFIGKQGTGKTYACCDFAQEYQKTLYLDTEYKASEIFDEKFPDLRYDMKEPIKDNHKKHAQIFKESSDVHIDVCQVIDETTGKRDNIATARYILNNIPLYIQLIKSGKYKNLVIDSCTPIWEYALKMWLKKHKRVRPNKFEYAEIEAIKQDFLLPFVNYCKIYNVNLILTFGIAGHYVNDVKIGYLEDAKQWLLNILSYELWFEYDYLKYCIKHPYRPFWYIQDEDLHISEYLFDKEFINDDVEYKEFEEFKYESMTSESYRKNADKRGSSLTIN